MTDTPLPPELFSLAREIAVYTPHEIEVLKSLADYSDEMDTLDANVFTLIQILPYVARSRDPGSQESAIGSFSRIVGLLEDALLLYLDKKEYRRAALILRALSLPVEPAFRQRLSEARRRVGDKKRIQAAVYTLRELPNESPEYEAFRSFLTLLDREATPVLLEMLAEEDDRAVRKTLVNILKDLGRNQIALLGERLSDERWYFVRNIVGILGESRKEDALEYLAGLIDHRNFQIRQEVVRALISIGGKRSAELLLRFLTDRDIDIRFMAARSLGILQVQGEHIEKALISMVKRHWGRTSLELRLEAISALGKIGGEGAALFLRKIAARRWPP